MANTRLGTRTGIMLVGLTLATASLVTSGPDAPAQTTATNASGIVCTTDVAGAPVFALEATVGPLALPDGNVVTMWSYAPAGGEFQTPGPILCVQQGDTVTVNLTVPAGFPVASSIVFPGQSGVVAAGGVAGPLTNEAQPGETVTYTFEATEPGTYLYESGTDQTTQIEMGMYGALVVRPSGHPDWAYADARTAFDPATEYLMIFHDIDPEFHEAVELDPVAPQLPRNYRHNRYFTINGRSFPDTAAPNHATWLPGQPFGALVHTRAHDPNDPNRRRALVRYVNAGLDAHPFHPHGNHLEVIGQDGRMLVGGSGEDRSAEVFTQTLAAGQTYDLLTEWLDLDRFKRTSNPLPVTIPGLQNVVFKDGSTFYSGSAYLGKKATMPSGVHSFNQCGEIYFPWHSHALQEIVNWDQTFGGMLTLWRVDPPAGCP